MHLLVAGSETELVAQLAASIKGVSKVLEIQSDNLKNQLAEPMAHAVVNIVEEYTHYCFQRRHLVKILPHGLLKS